MKKIVKVFLALFLFVFTPQIVKAQDDKTIYFFNWGDYIEPSILSDFEKETGYKVIYETYDANEAMLTKVRTGGANYDIVGPSDYMVEAMGEEGLLQELDHSKLPNLKTLNNKLLNQPFDPGNRYSVPYFWGTMGIIYNKAVLGEGAIKNWEDLWQPEYKDMIMITDSAREVIGLGLMVSGYSLNETDSNRLQEAADKMKELTPNIAAYLADEIRSYLSSGEKPIAVSFSGLAASVLEDGTEHSENIEYVVPETGSNIWFDNLAIPANAKNPEGAHVLINYLMRPDVMAKNAEYIGYATPSREALKLMDEEVVSNKAFYPSDEVIERCEIFRDIGKDKLIEYNDLFMDIKLSR